jgi:hypothetical protein
MNFWRRYLYLLLVWLAVGLGYALAVAVEFRNCLYTGSHADWCASTMYTLHWLSDE